MDYVSFTVLTLSFSFNQQATLISCFRTFECPAIIPSDTYSANSQRYGAIKRNTKIVSTQPTEDAATNPETPTKVKGAPGTATPKSGAKTAAKRGRKRKASTPDPAEDDVEDEEEEDLPKAKVAKIAKIKKEVTETIPGIKVEDAGAEA